MGATDPACQEDSEIKYFTAAKGMAATRMLSPYILSSNPNPEATKAAFEQYSLTTREHRRPF